MKKYKLDEYVPAGNPKNSKKEFAALVRTSKYFNFR
jgi:hypothetical protein